jgi:membrane protease YdiL (CAAX protease family)
VRDRRDWRGVLHAGPWRGPRAFGWGVLLILLVGGCGIGGNVLLQRVAHFPKDGPLAFVSLAIVLGVMLGVYVAAVRFGEQRPVTEFAWQTLAPELAAGLAGGIALFALVMALLIGAGIYDFSAPPPGSPWHSVRGSLSAGVFEELIFRAVLMRLVWEAFGLRVALVVSGVVFGLAHLLNPQHNLMGALSIIVEAGLMLGALYAVTGRLWANIGVHAGWNFTQGYIFGAAVSGTDAGPHYFLATPHPGMPALLTGGAFGPEASIVAVVAGGGAGVLLLLWARRRQATAIWAIP